MKSQLVVFIFFLPTCLSIMRTGRSCESYEYLSNQTKIRSIVPRVIYPQSPSWNEKVLPLFLYFRLSTGIYIMFHFVAIFSFHAYMLSLPPFRPTYKFRSLFEKKEQKDQKIKPVTPSTDSKTSLITSIDDTKLSDDPARNRSSNVMSEAKTQRSPRVPRATKGYQEDELATQEKFLDGLESATDH